MPDYLPFPHPVAGLTLKAASKGLEYRVPATGVETAQKLRNKDALGSNQMFDYKLREA
jgi:carboxymethylenebutenolidase